MRIRSVTIGADVTYPLIPSRFRVYDRFQKLARDRFQEAGLDVQTIRLATQPFPQVLCKLGARDAVAFAQQLEAGCRDHGVDYCSIGPVVATHPGVDLSFIDVIPRVIQHTEAVFASVLPATRRHGIHLAAIQRSAQAILNIALVEPNGFGNLRFAVLANCGPGSPFFPAAYHGARDESFTIATESADLAVGAFAAAATLDEARQRLRQAIEGAARVIEGVCRDLVRDSTMRFGGIDFSLAPYPEQARSIGHAMEELGIDCLGASGTLFATALITGVLREARFPGCGFCGVMLPVLEDSVLADRSTEGTYTLDSLLLYSAVCGTGLDTIPLPGDVSVSELAAILLDVSALALTLDKPLTARLMPIPGRKAGEMTDFHFPYVANARVLETKGYGAPRIFDRTSFMDWFSGHSA